MTLLQRLRLAANRRILAPLGLELRRIPEGRELDMGTSLALLRTLGLEPATVIDVGVRIGTPPLYQAFPDASFLLVEPVAEFEPAIRRLVATMKDAVYVPAALAASSGTGSLCLSDDQANSMLVEAGWKPSADDDRWRPEGLRPVPVKRLDEVVAEAGRAAPYLIKVDVDGRDLDVLRGAEQTLTRTDCVVLESGVWSLGERIAFLEQRGFVVWDLIDLFYKRNVLFQLDLVFLSRRLAEQQRFRPWLDARTFREGIHGHR